MNVKQRTAWIAMYHGNPTHGVFAYDKAAAWKELLRQLDIDADLAMARGYQVGKIVYEVVAD